MLLIIGKGGEGKSRIGRILKRIFGHNMNSGSLINFKIKCLEMIFKRLLLVGLLSIMR